MKQTITNAADITILRTIDNTLKTGGGPVSTGAVVLMAGKGKPFTVIQVVASTIEKYFGKYLARKATGAEGLRHLNDAAKELQFCNVVRVVADDYRYPSLAFATADGASTPGANTHDAALSIGAGMFLQVWPVDGDPSLNRSFEISNVVTDKGAYDSLDIYEVDDVVSVTGGRLICIAPHIATDTDPTLAIPTIRWRVYNGEYDNRVTINFYDKDLDGTEFLLESYLVGLNPFDKDDQGLPAYIETVLENQSLRFRANFDESLTFAGVHDALKLVAKTAFTGGTNGGDPVAADYITAWDLFRNELYDAKHMFAAGCYEADVLANCIDIADKRRVAFYFDISPSLPPDQAIVWLKGTGLESRNARVYHCPFEANDPVYGGKAVWGASGDAVASKCRGEAIFSGSTPGVHYAPAGVNRAKLTRTGMKPLFPESIVDRDAFYKARINPVIASTTGGAVIDDCLALLFKESYSRFAWVVDIDNYWAHRFLEGAAALKFEPDGLTLIGLTRIGKAIGSELVTSGALVKPRNTEDGDQPFTITVTQVEIDLWSEVWDFCPTGAARRIAGQPRLIR